jgi:hypothetical protein
MLLLARGARIAIELKKRMIGNQGKSDATVACIEIGKPQNRKSQPKPTF